MAQGCKRCRVSYFSHRLVEGLLSAALAKSARKMHALEATSGSCREEPPALPNELWDMIIAYVGPLWQPAAAQVCTLWRALVPEDRRRLDIKATCGLWRDLRSHYMGSRGDVVGRSSRLHQILLDLGALDHLCPTTVVESTDKNLIVAALLGTASHLDSRRIVEAVRDAERPGQHSTTARAPPTHMCSTDAIRVAARCGSGAFVDMLYHCIVPKYRDLSDLWTAAVADAHIAAIRALDITVFAALHRWAYRRCDRATLETILDEVGVLDRDREPWFYIVDHVQCPKCGTYDPRVIVSRERAADEAPTIRYHCAACSRTWRDEP